MVKLPATDCANLERSSLACFLAKAISRKSTLRGVFWNVLLLPESITQSESNESHASFSRDLRYQMTRELEKIRISVSDKAEDRANPQLLLLKKENAFELNRSPVSFFSFFSRLPSTKL